MYPNATSIEPKLLASEDSRRRKREISCADIHSKPVHFSWAITWLKTWHDAKNMHLEWLSLCVISCSISHLVCLFEICLPTMQLCLRLQRWKKMEVRGSKISPVTKASLTAKQEKYCKCRWVPLNVRPLCDTPRKEEEEGKRGGNGRKGNEMVNVEDRKRNEKEWEGKAEDSKLANDVHVWVSSPLLLVSSSSSLLSLSVLLDFSYPSRMPNHHHHHPPPSPPTFSLYLTPRPRGLSWRLNL